MTDIYSPEASDGTFDWPSKIGIAIELLIVALIIWWIA